MTEERDIPTAVAKERRSGRVAHDDPDEKAENVDRLVDGDGGPEPPRDSFFGSIPRITESTARANNGRRRSIEVSEARERVEDGLGSQDKEKDRERDQQVGDLWNAVGDELRGVPYVHWTVAFLLARLRLRNGCGEELARRMSALGLEAARPQTVYQTLRQMEEEGMIVSEPEGLDHRPSSRRYEITGLGEAYLEYLANALAQYRREMDLFLQIYDEQCTAESRGRSTKTSE